jgi:hypothetical protein
VQRGWGFLQFKSHHTMPSGFAVQDEDEVSSGTPFKEPKSHSSPYTKRNILLIPIFQESAVQFVPLPSLAPPTVASLPPPGPPAATAPRTPLPGPVSQQLHRLQFRHPTGPLTVLAIPPRRPRLPLRRQQAYPHASAGADLGAGETSAHPRRFWHAHICAWASSQQRRRLAHTSRQMGGKLPSPRRGRRAPAAVRGWARP